ncbi:MAG TPA: hypothetical protein VIJ82_28570 [Streptosporangiaceae bacterium]
MLGPSKPGKWSGRGSPSERAAASPEITLYLIEDRDRIAEGLSALVVHRLFSAGLALEAALGLMDEHPAAKRVEFAVTQLDRAIGDLRNVIFDNRRLNPPSTGEPG